MTTTVSSTCARGHGRPAGFPHRTAAVLAALLSASAAHALPPPVPVTQFDMTGFLQSATIDTTDVLSGGTLTVNGQVIVVPRNVIVVMPATFLTWEQVFALAPPPYGPSQTGLAMADVPAPFVPYEVHVVGNRVAVAGGPDRYIAGLVSLSQQSLNSGNGYINYIDYTTGEFRVGGIIGDPTTGQRVRLNDPLGRFGRVSSTDPRFTIDEENPTVRTETAYPMCIPRVDPATGPDALCPQSNRPFDPVTGLYSTIFTMPDPATVVPGGLDPMLTAPFEVGDWVSYIGTLVKDGTQPSVGPNPTIATAYVSAWQVIANVGIHTAPGTNPAYVAIDVTILGTGGVSALGAVEATIRTRFEGFTTDPFFLPGTDPTCSDPNFKKTLGQPCSAVDLYGIDVDPCAGTATDRPWGAIDVDPGPPTGVKPGRWRFRPPGRTLPLVGATGVFDPPTQEVRARLRGATATLTKNGLLAGQYHAPITQYIFPENGATGTPLVPNNFESFPYLVNGLGPLGGPGSPLVGQLSPWPGAAAPVPVNCAVATLTPPTAKAGLDQTVASGASVTLDGTASTDPNGLALTFAWTAPPGVTLNSATAAAPTFTAPTVPAGGTPQVLSFTLIVTDTAGLSSAPATVNITVNPAPAVFLAPVANAGLAQTVASAANVVLNGTASSDPNTPPLALSFVWTQVSPAAPLVTLTGATTATPIFQAPIVPPGAPLVIQFNVTVTNTAGLSATALVNVTVNPVVPPLANAGANQTVLSGAAVALNGSASVDPNGLPITFQWTQVSGAPVTLSGANTATPSFTAPTLVPGQTPVVLGFSLVVSDAFLSSTPALVTVTVQPGADTITITSVVYRISKQRLDVTATSSVPTAQLSLVWNGQNIPLTLAGGVPTVTLVGVAQPASVTVVSNLGGTATSPVTKLRQ